MADNHQFHTVRGYEMLEKNEKLLTYGMEDYLEMIYRLSHDEGYTRINDLSEALNVKASSTTKMVQRLAELNLIKYKKYGIIQFTEKGQSLGKFLIERHMALESFLEMIGVNENILENVELIEHNMTQNALEKIQVLNCFFNNNPEIHEQYIKFKDKYLEQKEITENKPGL